MSENLIGATTAIFFVSLSIAVNEPVDVAWSTRDGTAKAGTDYQAANGVVNFLPGETQKQIEVIVYGQNVSPTSDKNFFINLMPPTNAVLGTALIEAVIKVEDESGVPVTSVVVAQGKRGLKGDPGLSAYEQAVLMGFQGTIEDWMQEQADAAAAAQRAGDYAANAAAAATKAENAATAASFLGNIFPTPEAGVDPVTGVKNGAYYNVRSPSDESYLVEYQNIGGVPTPSGKTYPSSAYVQQLSQQVVDISAAVPMPYVPEKSYNLGERVELANGDTVSSTKDNNTSNPNTEMADWVKISDGRQVRINDAAKASVIYAEEYNLSESEDNTAIYNQIIADAAHGAKIVFPFNKTLYGHFISENKALKLDLNGSTLTNTVDNKPIIQIGSLSVNEYTVSELVLHHGATQFTVANASTLFEVGDIGYLWDGATRSTTGNVNFEVVKIKAVSGNVITIENFLASYKGASTIRFYHSPGRLKGVEVKNVILKPTITHTANTTLITNCENIRTDNIESEGTTGAALSIRYCYDVISNDTRPRKAAAVGSGQGYGLQLFGVSKFTVNSVKGSGMRHVYDQDSTYFFIIRDIEDDDDQSAPVTLAHNGFAGYGLCENVRVTTSQYPVVLSEQGYGGTVAALKQDHPFRNIHVKNVTARIRDDVDPSSNTGVYGVYFQNSVVGCSVDNVDIEVLHPNAMTSTSGSSLVRVNGVVNKGLTLSNLKANKIGRVFVGTGGTRSGFPHDNTKSILRNLSIGDCGQIYLTQGNYFVDLDGVTITGSPKAGKIGTMTVTGSDVPLGAYHNVANISYDGTGIAQLDCNATNAILGSIGDGYKTAALGLSITDGKTITLNELQERMSWVRLDHPIGTGSITVNLPKPQTVNDQLRVNNPSGRPSVILSGTNMNAAVTVATGEIVTLRVVGSKWSLVSRGSNS